jgi:hypothetical protein
MEKFDAALEKEIEQLAAEIKERASAATPEAQKEAVKAAVGERIGLGTLAPPAAGPAPASPILPNYLQNAPSDVKLRVENLVDLAWHKGIPVAVKAAQKAGSLYVDALHDALTDKLYEEFKKRKLI